MHIAASLGPGGRGRIEDFCNFSDNFCATFELQETLSIDTEGHTPTTYFAQIFTNVRPQIFKKPGFQKIEFP